jgi:peptide chain release factor 3
MDPAHRDRIAFVRAGHLSAACGSACARQGAPANTVVSFPATPPAARRAFAGDIIGILNHGVLQLGDTLSEGEALQYTGLPFPAPEMFRSVEVADPLRSCSRAPA